MYYRLVFDLEDAGYQWGWLWVPLLLVFVAFKGRRDRGSLAVIMLGVVLPFTIVLFAGTYYRFHVLTRQRPVRDV
jgi:hypothetical protein